MKVADIGRPHTIAKLQCTRPDEQIGQRDADALRVALVIDLSGAQCNRHGYRLDGDAGLPWRSAATVAVESSINPKFAASAVPGGRR